MIPSRSFVRFLSLSLVAAAGVTLAACAADTDAEQADPAAVDEGTDEQDVTARVIGEESNNKTVEVQLGRPFTIALADNAASSGYRWKVKSVDRTIGAPKESYAAPPKNGPIGASGTRKFTWKTKSPLNLVGKHKITFELQRPWAETSPPARTFTVTINITDPGPTVANCGGLAGFQCKTPNTYCQYAASQMCGAADQMGTCQIKPDACTAQYLPVCGCDGNTYSNACMANAAGTSVSKTGACN